MGGKVRQELKSKLDRVSDRVKDGSKMEKEAWAELDEVEDEVAGMISEVDTSVHAAVSSTLHVKRRFIY